MFVATNRMAFGIVLTLVFGVVTTGSAFAQRGAEEGEWRYYGGDAGTTKYSPLDQIDRANVADLQIAWRWRTDNFGPRVDFNYQATPLMVGGVLYTTAGWRRNVVAIDGATGETLWMYRYDEGERGDRAPVRASSGRGVAYWTDGRGDERIIHVTKGYHLIALSGTTGQPVPTFGEDGIVDLYQGLFDGLDRPVVEDGQIGLNSPAMVVGDVIVVGAALRATAPSPEFPAGFVRGFDARTGAQLWTFHTIPQAGEFGNDTWENDSWRYSGNTGVWAPMSADIELGYVGRFKRSSQHLNGEELRWEHRNVVGHPVRDVFRCGRRVVPRRDAVSIGVGSGRRSPAGCPATRRRWGPACPSRSERDGSAKVEACRRSAWPFCRGATCRLPSETRSPSCTPSTAGFVISLGESAGPRRPSLGSSVAMRQPAVADSSIARRPRSGTPT